jgi:hypothetical protein
MSVIRSWLCLNHICTNAFDSWDANPSCPACHGVRVQWVPGGGHMGGTAKACDAEFRALTDAFRMTDLHSAARGEAAKPKLVQKPNKGATHTFAGGFTAPVDMTQSQCVPTSNNISFKTAAAIGKQLPGVGQHRKVS